MLFKLAFQNIKANKWYFLAYILTITFFFVIVYQVGNINLQLGSYLNNNGFAGISSSEMFKTLKGIIYAIVIIFSAYIANFFIKRRSNEVALLKTLGLNRFNIFKMICIENVIVILISFIFSIIVSLVTSPLFVFISEKLIGFHLDSSLPISSIISCLLSVLYLAIIILIIISIIPLFTVLKTNILLLFQDTKKSYVLKKKPWISFILFLIFSVILIYMSLFVVTKPTNLNVVILLSYFLCAILVAIFLYRGLFSFFFVSSKRKKKPSTSSVRLLSFSHLAYRIPALSRMMSLITIITSIVVVLCVAAFGMFNALLNSKDNYGTQLNIVTVANDKNKFNSLNNAYHKAKDIAYDTIPMYVAENSDVSIKSKLTDDGMNNVNIERNGVVLLKYSDYLKLQKVLVTYGDHFNLKNEYQLFDANIVYNDNKEVHNDYNNAEIDCQNSKLCDFFNKYNLNLDKFSYSKNDASSMNLLNNYNYPKKPTAADKMVFERTKYLYNATIVVMNDNNKAFKDYKPLYFNIGKLKISKDSFTNLLEINKIATSATIDDNGIYSISNGLTLLMIMVFLMVGMFQTILLIGLLTITIALIMSIFFRTLENLENSLDDYIMAKQFGMSKAKILKSLFIEAFVTQALPFVVGIVVSILLFKQMFTSYDQVIPFKTVLTDPLTLMSLGSLTLLLIVLIIILVKNIYSRIKFSNLKKSE
ncbi:MAG: FtsX-like permease family protein [Bacilli bacterium]|jgi:hypothetical protein|nr:FtsX-like permease family protein [Bacilli bacterium]